jgi:hypothetical protein
MRDDPPKLWRAGGPSLGAWSAPNVDGRYRCGRGRTFAAHRSADLSVVWGRVAAVGPRPLAVLTPGGRRCAASASPPSQPGNPPSSQQPRPSKPSSQHSQPTRPSSTNPQPEQPSPKSRQSDHHHDSLNTKSPAGTLRRGPSSAQHVLTHGGGAIIKRRDRQQKLAVPARPAFVRASAPARRRASRHHTHSSPHPLTADNDN